MSGGAPQIRNLTQAEIDEAWAAFGRRYGMPVRATDQLKSLVRETARVTTRDEYWRCGVCDEKAEALIVEARERNAVAALSRPGFQARRGAKSAPGGQPTQTSHAASEAQADGGGLIEKKPEFQRDV